MTAYYNEIDEFAADTLESLIARNLIPKGDVDRRSIEEVKPDDIKQYTQHHFFAGIGGWPYAFRLAGWPDDKPVWSGSVPCQPFSRSGKGAGSNDERHLWPTFFRLIAECKPSVCFGEQVSGTLGRTWLAAIRLDLEAIGYACGAADIPAASVGAPHRRNRLFWVSDTDSTRWNERKYSPEKGSKKRIPISKGSHDDGICNTDSKRLERHARNVAQLQESGWHGPFAYGSCAASSAWSNVVYLPFRDGKWRPIPTEPGLFPLAHGIPKRVAKIRVIGNAIVPQLAAAFIQASGLLDSQYSGSISHNE